jgi:hypothetical protein
MCVCVYVGAMLMFVTEVPFDTVARIRNLRHTDLLLGPILVNN